MGCRLRNNRALHNIILQKLSIIARDDDSLVFGSPHSFRKANILVSLDLMNVLGLIVFDKTLLKVENSNVRVLLILVQNHHEFIAEGQANHL